MTDCQKLDGDMPCCLVRGLQSHSITVFASRQREEKAIGAYPVMPHASSSCILDDPKVPHNTTT
jgi:hypothetical protein